MKTKKLILFFTLYALSISIFGQQANSIKDDYLDIPDSSFQMIDYNGGLGLHIISFIHSRPFKHFDIVNSTLDNGFYVNNLTLINKGIIKNDSFKGNLSFNNCFFIKGVHVSDIFLYKELRFDSSRINGALVLNNIKQANDSRLTFNNTILPDTVYFAYNDNIPKEVDFNTANYLDSSRYYWLRKGRPASLDRKDNKWVIFRSYKLSFNKIYLNLYKSDINKVHLDYSYFRLLLTDPNTGLKLPMDEARSLYEALLNNFKVRGQMKSYELCDIEYQEYKWSEKSKWWSWLYVFPKYWNNYGYDKGRVFLWTIVFLIIFTYCTYKLFDPLSREVYPIDNIPQQPLLKFTKKTPLDGKLRWNRVWYSFVYTSIIFFLLTIKIERINYRNKHVVFYLMIVYTIGIICIAYMANYIITR